MIERPDLPELDSFSQALYESAFTKNLYDEVGNKSFGWYALVTHNKKTYIISIDRKGIFSYKEYAAKHSAKKAWDHICLKFEKWYTERNHE